MGRNIARLVVMVMGQLDHLIRHLPRAPTGTVAAQGGTGSSREVLSLVRLIPWDSNPALPVLGFSMSRFQRGWAGKKALLRCRGAGGGADTGGWRQAPATMKWPPPLHFQWEVGLKPCPQQASLQERPPWVPTQPPAPGVAPAPAPGSLHAWPQRPAGLSHPEPSPLLTSHSLPDRSQALPSPRLTGPGHRLPAKPWRQEAGPGGGP